MRYDHGLQTESFGDFTCAGASCSETCCAGWRVFLDEDYVSRTKSFPLPLRARSALALRHREGDPVYNDSQWRCGMHKLSGLCSVQLSEGEEALPLVCRTYPRECVDMGGFRSERYLDLSCVQASSMFLDCIRRSTDTADGQGDDLHEKNDDAKDVKNIRRWITLKPSDKASQYVRRLKNDDAVFLEGLLQNRKKLMDEALHTDKWEDMEFLFRRSLMGAYLSEQRVIRGDDPFTGSEEAMPPVNVPAALFPMEIGTLNRIVNECIYDDDIIRRMPFLYRMCRAYFRRYDRLSVAEGQKLLDSMVNACVNKNGIRKYASYFAYYLMRFYMEIFEDYSFSRKIWQGIINTNLLLLFDAVVSDSGGERALSPRFSPKKALSDEIPPEVQARMMAVIEKRVFHNAPMRGKLMKIVYG